MIKLNYKFNPERLSLETEVNINGPLNLQRIELGMIIYYLIKNKRIDKKSVDNLTDVVNDAVNLGLSDDEMISHFLKAAYGIIFEKDKE